MPFRIALSGLNAASTDLEVTGNNIANSATNGFKQSRTEFADVFANAIQDTSSNAAGQGVRVSRVAQQFGQGTIDFTSNNLDLAISGQGWMKWAYVEMADLDSLDREYNFKEEREATEIAMLIMERASYSPEAMLTFWQRVEKDKDLSKKAERLRRDLTLQERSQIIDELLTQKPTENEVNIPKVLQTSQRDINAVNHSIQ